MEARKDATHAQRTTDRADTVDAWARGLLSRQLQHAPSGILPLMTTAMVVDLLARHHVTVHACPGEADDIVASLAAQWSCPVLSGDSDFLVYPRIPGVLLLNRVEARRTPPYIRARLFTRAHLANALSVADDVMPWLAVLVGNDFVTLSDSMLARILTALAGADRPVIATSLAVPLRVPNVAQALSPFRSAEAVRAVLVDRVGAEAALAGDTAMVEAIRQLERAYAGYGVVDGVCRLPARCRDVRRRLAEMPSVG